MDDLKETGRVEAFSDGVFAVAITLLVLNIQVPTDIREAKILKYPIWYTPNMKQFGGKAWN